jgi:hypothetical protein
VISLRFARRALDLDPTCTTARVMSILSVLSALWILVVVGLIVVSFLG